MTIRLVCECTFSQGSPLGLNILGSTYQTFPVRSWFQ